MFSVMAEKWSTNHRYVVGVFKEYDDAVVAAMGECIDRGGKYCTFYIQAWDTSTGKELEEKLEVIEFEKPF